MKKFFFFSALFLALSALFYKQILGSAVRLILKIEFDLECAYRSLDWQNGEIVFSDLVLFDPSFHTHMEKASLRLDGSSFPKKLKGHLHIDSPQISRFKKRDLPQIQGGWFDFTVSIHNGTVDWEGPVRFSLDHTKEMSQLLLDWDDSGAIFTLHEGNMEAELRNFRAPLLKRWVPFVNILDGHLTGRLAMNEQQELVSANVKIAGIGIAADFGAIENMEGALSYNAKLGAKWELKGFGNAQGKQFPLTWQGRGFFKSHWVESEIQFEEGSCEISGEKTWTLQCEKLHSEQAALLQAGLASIWPEISLWELDSGLLSGKATFDPSSWSAQFQGENLTLRKGDVSLLCDAVIGDLTQDGGSLILKGKEHDLKVTGTWSDWIAEGSFQALHLCIHGGWDGKKFPIQIEQGTFSDAQFSGEGWIDPQLDLFLRLEGSWSFLQKEIPFRCPILSKRGSEWVFDFRLDRQTWNLCRLAGTFDGEEFVYSEKSHFLGASLHFASMSEMRVQLPWKSILSAGPFLKEWGLDLAKVPKIDEAEIYLQYAEGRTILSAKGCEFVLHAEQFQDLWTVDLQSDLTLSAQLQKDGSAKGKGKWKTGVAVEFEGKIHPSLQCEFSLPKVEFDLAQFEDLKMEGKLTGQGHFIYNGQVKADFDFLSSSLKIYSHEVENNGPIHLYYSSEKGALFRGVDLHGDFDCIVDLVEYKTYQSSWILHDAQVHLPKYEIDALADLEFTSDFSHLSCHVHEGIVPFDGTRHYIQNLHVLWKNNDCWANLDEIYKLRFHVADTITGRLILGVEETPLTIDWEYRDFLSIHSMEGSFGGVEASFHLESKDTLIGSARIDFTALSKYLPKDVATVFHEIKMGKGYELKGRLKMEKNLPFFQGILCGKQIELFGFQFRTILGQVDLGPERMRIYDVKISDTAGMMKIEELLMEGKKNVPWTIAIPTLLISEFRPSLLQRPGGAIGPINPIVVRELKLTDFKGLLERSKTYTAKGKLHFINSYKREETVFDLPANVFSRIVGLDLELLIPVTGDLDFELKDGFFNLTELTNAYSEGKRSEFFLEMDPPPSMDLDGNLQIFIKMKQFVLLKFTESFLISVEGQLEDPQFRLKRRRFFGLM